MSETQTALKGGISLISDRDRQKRGEGKMKR